MASDLPVVTGEVGDTWMTSTTADAWKITYYREASRAIKLCLDSRQCDVHEPRVAAYLRMLIKIPEHTYGFPSMDDSTNWTNDQFRAVIAAREPAYVNTLASYTEQRDIVTREGMRYLADHPLAANITARMAALVPSVPDIRGFVAIDRSAWATPFTVTTVGGSVTLGFDGTTGALSTAVLAGVSWGGPDNLIGQYIYKTYNDTDLDAPKTVSLVFSALS